MSIRIFPGNGKTPPDAKNPLIVGALIEGFGASFHVSGEIDEPEGCICGGRGQCDWCAERARDRVDGARIAEKEPQR